MLLPNRKVILPRDSISRIISGNMDPREDVRQREAGLMRTVSTKSCPPILQPHASASPPHYQAIEEEGWSKTEQPPAYSDSCDPITPPPNYNQTMPQFITQVPGNKETKVLVEQA